MKNSNPAYETVLIPLNPYNCNIQTFNMAHKNSNSVIWTHTRNDNLLLWVFFFQTRKGKGKGIRFKWNIFWHVLLVPFHNINSCCCRRTELINRGMDLHNLPTDLNENWCQKPKVIRLNGVNSDVYAITM